MITFKDFLWKVFFASRILHVVDLSKLFDTFQDSAFRLEGLSVYSVPEETDAFRYYSKYGHTPEGFSDDWAAFVKDKVNSGKTIQRLRLLSDKLTEYEKFETSNYSGLRNGEDIRIAKRSEHPFEHDFWLFDNTWIARMNYDTNGALLNCEISEVSSEDLQKINYWLSIFTSAKSLR